SREGTLPETAPALEGPVQGPYDGQMAHATGAGGAAVAFGRPRLLRQILALPGGKVRNEDDGMIGSRPPAPTPETGLPGRISRHAGRCPDSVLAPAPGKPR